MIMKTIEVTDEMYDFLISTSNKMKEQDNRITASPYIFQVQETRMIPTFEGGSDKTVWWSSEYEIELRTDEEIRSFLYDYTEETEDNIDTLSSDGLNDFISEYKDFKLFYETENRTLSNVFFTEDSCEEHIKINGHNLHRPRSYVSHCYRNKEIETIQNFILSLTDN